MFMEQLYRKDNSPSRKEAFKDNCPSWKDNCPSRKTSLEASLPGRTLLRPSQKDCVYGTASCTFFDGHGPVALARRVEVAGGVARLREVEAVKDALEVRYISLQ